MAITIQIKRDTASNWTSNAPTLAAGEFGFETDTGKFKVGDGSTAWASLNYFEFAAPSGPSYSFQGSTSGYTSGGNAPPFNAPPIYCNIIDKFSFSSDANATDVADLTVEREGTAGQSSADNGYNSGGYAPTGCVNTIDKFPFSSDSNATDVGDLTSSRAYTSGQSSASNGYTAAGWDGNTTNVIDKFPFSSDANATDVGDIITAVNGTAGQSSADNGYNSGGRCGEAYFNVIQKWPFSSDANATDVGDLTEARNSVSGQSSTTSGYTTTGYSPAGGGYVNTIDKFPFSSDANATDVGDMLPTSVFPSGGQSSTANGYSSGGFNRPGNTKNNVIAKFPFSSDGNGTDVGDLTVARYNTAGQQV